MTTEAQLRKRMCSLRTLNLRFLDSGIRTSYDIAGFNFERENRKNLKNVILRNKTYCSSNNQRIRREQALT